MADPIRQEIQTTYDGKGVEGAVKGMNALDRGNDELARSTETRAQKMARLQDELVELIAKQDQYEREAKEAGQSDEIATRHGEARRQQIARLSTEIAQETKYQNMAAEAVDRAAGSHERASGRVGLMAQGYQSALAAAQGLVGGLIGVGGLMAALQAIRAEMEENVKAAREFAEASLNLQFMSDQFKPQEREFIGQAAEFSGRQPVEVAGAMADLKSRFPNLSDEQTQKLFMEVGETARTTPAPLSALVQAFSTIRQYESDPQKVQNILRASITQSGVSDPAQLSPLMAKFMGLGQQLNLSAGQSAGAVAAATGLGLAPEESITGLRNIALSLQGKGTPDGAKVLKRLKIDRTNFLHALDQLAEANNAGLLKTKDIEDIGGRESVAVLSSLLDKERLADFQAKIKSVADAQQSPRDLTAEAIKQQFESDPLQETNFKLKRAEAEASTQKAGDVESMRTSLARQIIENRMRRDEIPPYLEKEKLWFFDAYTGFGGSPEDAASFVAPYSQKKSYRHDVEQGLREAVGDVPAATQPAASIDAGADVGGSLNQGLFEKLLEAVRGDSLRDAIGELTEEMRRLRNEPVVPRVQVDAHIDTSRLERQRSDR